MEDIKKVGGEEIDLLELFFVLLNKVWILAITAILGAVLAGLVTKFAITPMYESTSKLYILTTSTSITSLADIQVGTSLTKDYAELILSRPVVEQVIENLKINRTYEEMTKQLTVTNKSDTRIVVIRATDPDPVLAKDIVDQFAVVSSERISTIMKTDAPSIVELGVVAEHRVSPSFSKNILVGFMAGFVISAAIIIMLHLLDDTVKTTEDVEKYLKLNTLAAIPLAEGEKKSSTKKFFKGGAKNGK